MLEMMFGESRFIESNKQDFNKRNVVWNIMIKDKWTKEEYDKMINKFIETHKEFYFMPYHILSLLDREVVCW